MARRTVEMEPTAAFAEMVTALAEAGRYGGHGMWTTSKRAGRGARVVGTEAARRAALAARVLAGQPPAPRRSRRSLILVVVAATAAGAVAAMAVRQSVTALRTRGTGEVAEARGTAPGDGAVSEAQRAETGRPLRDARDGAG